MELATDLTTAVDAMVRDVSIFAEHGGGLRLRSYQLEAARAIVRSVLRDEGLTFVVIFPRQSGKNELQAQIETYLLSIFNEWGAEIIKVSPTWKPQSLNAMRRLESVLKNNLMSRIIGWVKEQGYIYRLNTARIFFLSGSPTANVVGATANILLECDEAQDVSIAKWDKEVNPMAASMNATRVFWGTAWTSQTLLAREMRAAQEAQKRDGMQRVFVMTADEVKKEVPAYGRFVDAEIAKMGRNHPFVKTQYFSEEIDAEGGMFPPGRVAMMQGEHKRLHVPEAGRVYAFLIDVAGEDEGATLAPGDEVLLSNAGRDSTALTIVEVDHVTLADPLIQAPCYKVVERVEWVGVKHTSLYGQLVGLCDLWVPRYVVIDATGVGAGLASFLERSLGERLIKFVFTGKSKSKLGWDFIAIIETRRYLEYRPELWARDADQVRFYQQLAACQMEILPGQGRVMRWSVPDGTRDAATGELVHDDLVLSAALCAVLDGQVWGVAVSEVVRAVDPLDGMREVW